ncbi:hypothetical protein [Paenibacillus radicis (ex Gao et al. 2016)]|uniref:Antigen I/II N-terminal domain-containing protein n=1 Tax=Paenibacillus radicis (ex Gao et al. 2016) TaxID=1737354 RepID=A0A917HRK7_9BACL|nr:hypothetical protein [Paenibacillus radicis (ex Gao et al. 2016)]GGG87990.1 hypothetical protein GCM10010918_53010 [Paenibacillus radicis (ex Gao et al. 2016)]
MMKKLAIALFATAIILAGCSSSNDGKGASEPVNQTNNAEKTDKEKGVEVDKNLTNVKITLPASMFKDADVDQVIAQAKEDDGVKEATKNEDGSVTYTMSKSDHKKMLKEMEDGIADSIKKLKEEGTFASIKDVTYNKSMNEYEMIVDKAAYEGSMDGFAALGFGMQGMYYQIFQGVDSDKTKVTIKVKDEKSGEVFDTIVYPETLEQE